MIRSGASVLRECKRLRYKSHSKIKITSVLRWWWLQAFHWQYQGIWSQHLSLRSAKRCSSELMAIIFQSSSPSSIIARTLKIFTWWNLTCNRTEISSELENFRADQCSSHYRRVFDAKSDTVMQKVVLRKCDTLEKIYFLPQSPQTLPDALKYDKETTARYSRDRAERIQSSQVIHQNMMRTIWEFAFQDNEEWKKTHMFRCGRRQLIR